MTITIELPSASVEVAAAEARAQGLELQEYLSQQVDQYLRSLSERRGTRVSTAEAPFSREQFERDWDDFSAGSEHWPVLSDDALSREAMYAEHD